MSSPARFEIKSLWPLLFVGDLERSVDFYTRELGFEVVGRAERERRLYWCRLKRGAASFMLQQHQEPASFRPPPAGTVVFYFVCDDADAVFMELKEKGMVLDPPTEAYYGMKQLAVPDPDGHEVIFESPTEAWAE